MRLCSQRAAPCCRAPSRRSRALLVDPRPQSHAARVLYLVVACRHCGFTTPVDTKALCSAIQHPPRHPLIRLKTEDADTPGLTSSEQVTLAGAARGRCWAWLGQQGLDGFWARGSGTEGQPPGKVKWLCGRIIHDLIPDPLLLTHIRDRP